MYLMSFAFQSRLSNIFLNCGNNGKLFLFFTGSCLCHVISMHLKDIIVIVIANLYYFCVPKEESITHVNFTLWLQVLHNSKCAFEPLLKEAAGT